MNGNSNQYTPSSATTSGISWIPNTTTSWPYWYQAPIYHYSDRTEKAMDIAKKLMIEGIIEADQTKDFIEIVEKIKALL